MDAPRLTALRGQLLEDLAIATAGIGHDVIRAVRDLPPMDTDHSRQVVFRELAAAILYTGRAEWMDTLDCLRDEVARIASSGTHIDRMRAWLRAYETAGVMLALLEGTGKASCEACGGFRCSGTGVVHRVGRAA